MNRKIIKKLNILIMVIMTITMCCGNITFADTISKTNSATVFDRNDNVWKAKYFRIPSGQILDDGTIIAFSDIRYNGATDHGFIDIGSAISNDNGKTWEYNTVMLNDRVNSTYSRVMDSTTVVTSTGRIILIAGSWNKNGNWASSTTSLRDDWSVQMVYSDDNGKTWSEKIDLTKRITNQPSNTIGWLGGVGSGIVMEDGTIVMPAQIALREYGTNNYYSTIIYSKDNGDTWTMGNKVPHRNTSENMVIELDGALIMSARYDHSGYRAAYISYDLGKTWKVYEPLHNKISTGSGAGCQGSFIKITTPSGDRIGLISAPKNTLGGYNRDNITVYMINFDDLSKGIKEICVPYPQSGNRDGGGYSSLVFNNETLGIFYEADGNIEYKDLTNYYMNIIDSSEKNYEYLSDIAWEKAQTSYGEIRRDMAHDGVNKLTLKSENIIYEKGVGIHSTGEIVIDLRNKGYSSFEASVGVLQNLNDKWKDSSSVQYEFYLDNKLVASTDIMDINTPKQDISFSIGNASKLKILVKNGKNGNSGWGVLGDAKFITSNGVKYISDISWESAKTSYGSIGRDIAHDGVNKLILRDKNITYDKGVGIHSTGEIIIDLRGRNYSNFEVSVGVLQNLNDKWKDSSSVQYEFYLDGKLVSKTNIMDINTPKQDISFSVRDASKLKIVVKNGKNGNSGWGVLGNARFMLK